MRFYEIDHTHVYGWVRVIKDEWNPRAHESRKLSTNGSQKEDKNFCLTDKPLIALYMYMYMALGCLDG